MNAFFSQLTSAVRARPFIAACVLVTLLLAAANYPIRLQRRAAAIEHDQIRHKGELMIRSMADRTRIETDLNALDDAIAQIDRNLLDEQSMEVNLGYFYRMERAARVRLMRLNQLVAPLPAAPDMFKTVPFSMQVTGSYRNTLNFVRALETGPRIVRIQNCSLERGTAERPDLTLDLTVEVLARL